MRSEANPLGILDRVLTGSGGLLDVPGFSLPFEESDALF